MSSSLTELAYRNAPVLLYLICFSGFARAVKVKQISWTLPGTAD